MRHGPAPAGPAAPDGHRHSHRHGQGSALHVTEAGRIRTRATAKDKGQSSRTREQEVGAFFYDPPFKNVQLNAALFSVDSHIPGSMGSSDILEQNITGHERGEKKKASRAHYVER